MVSLNSFSKRLQDRWCSFSHAVCLSLCLSVSSSFSPNILNWTWPEYFSHFKILSYFKSCFAYFLMHTFLFYYKKNHIDDKFIVAVWIFKIYIHSLTANRLLWKILGLSIWKGSLKHKLTLLVLLWLWCVYWHPTSSVKGPIPQIGWSHLYLTSSDTWLMFFLWNSSLWDGIYLHLLRSMSIISL